jgi:hypothetical protein
MLEPCLVVLLDEIMFTRSETSTLERDKKGRFKQRKPKEQPLDRAVGQIWLEAPRTQNIVREEEIRSL